MELISGGRTVEVTTSNVYDYVRKYAEYRMVKSQEKALQVDIFVVFYTYTPHMVYLPMQYGSMYMYIIMHIC